MSSKLFGLLFEYVTDTHALVLGLCLTVSFILFAAAFVLTFRGQQIRNYVATCVLMALLVGIMLGVFIGFYNVPLVKTGGAFKPKVFWTVWDNVARDSLKKPSQNEMFTNVLKSIAATTKDKYTEFLTAEENAKTKEYLPGKEIPDKIDYIVTEEGLEITFVHYESPAYKAGLEINDIILFIDDCEWENLSDKIRTPGTHKFRVLKSGTGKEVEMEFEVGATIKIQGVRWWIERGIAYMLITSFEGDVVEEFEKAASEIVKQKPKGLILDLRWNFGGGIPKMLKIANAWMPGKIVQIRKFPNGTEINDYSIKSKVGGKFKNLATVVLIGRYTASASEGFVGGLKYHTAARFVGERTYGKTVAQESTEFPDGSQLRVTKWKWTNPGGFKYEGGIKPDIETAPANAFLKAWEILSQ